MTVNRGKQVFTLCAAMPPFFFLARTHVHGKPVHQDILTASSALSNVKWNGKMASANISELIYFKIRYSSVAFHQKFFA